MFEGLFLKLAGQAKVLEMPEHIRNKYTRTMTTEIDKRAQLKYAREEGLEEGRAKGLCFASLSYASGLF